MIFARQTYLTLRPQGYRGAAWQLLPSRE